MTNEEVGCYIKLLCFCWKEGEISGKIEKISKIFGEKNKKSEKIWEKIVHCFYKKNEKNGEIFYGHKRLDLELEKINAYKQRQSDAGKASGKARAENRKRTVVNFGSNQNATNTPTKTKSSSSSSSSSSLKDKHPTVESKDSTERREPKKSAKPKTNPDIKSAIDFYSDEFLKRFGTRPHIAGGKDAAIIKKLLVSHDLAKLKSLICLYLDSDDPFIAQSGRSLALFATQINKLLIHGSSGARASPKKETRGERNRRICAEMMESDWAKEEPVTIDERRQIE